MPFVGTDFNTLIDIKSDRAYSNYFDPTKKNVIVREALYKAIDFKVATNDKIQVQDDLFGIYKVDTIVVPVTNAINIQPTGLITDYYHLMNLSPKFVVIVPSTAITDATNTTPIRITLSKDSNLRTGQRVVIGSVTSNTNANGNRYLKRLNNKTYELYSDANLQNPIVGNGIFSNGSGLIYQVVYNYAKDLKSNRKFSILNEPNIYSPFYEIGSSAIRIYPQDVPCSEVTIDYISTPVLIDVQNASTDLLLTYSERFLEFIADETCRLMGLYSRDVELNTGSQAEMIQQP